MYMYSKNKFEMSLWEKLFSDFGNGITTNPEDFGNGITTNPERIVNFFLKKVNSSAENNL